MTRRVVIAIIINVWLVLLTAGCSTYFITRSLLLADLDNSIVRRVASLPGIQPSDAPPRVSPDPDDRYVIQDKAGQRWSSLTPAPAGAGGAAPEILTRGFSQLSDGPRMRTLTLRALAQPPGSGAAPEPVTVIYSASARHVDDLLSNLLYSFCFLGILVAVASALAAHGAARAALRPMRETAEMISHIDERSLNRRIALEKLPSELAPMGVKLNDMLARLEAAFTQRRQFLANASHELRTPVAALVTSLEVTLRRRRDNEEYVRVLDQSLADARLLNQLVVTLIEQARLDRLGDAPDYGPVVLSQFLRRCLATLAAPAQKKGLQLDCEVRQDATVFTDEGLLRSAILNLLTNAVEYTPALGQVVLSAELEEPPSPLPEALRQAVPEEVAGVPRQLVIAVRDNGPGIKPEHRASIFEPFFRADASRADARHHLGLGLAAVRLNVRALGGDCTLESPPRAGGTGCVFRLTLPTIVPSAEKRPGVRLPGLTSQAPEKI